MTELQFLLKFKANSSTKNFIPPPYFSIPPRKKKYVHFVHMLFNKKTEETLDIFKFKALILDLRIQH